jgi:tripartite-type tricarboxylate transporter receptor subunit TctC
VTPRDFISLATVAMTRSVLAAGPAMWVRSLPEFAEMAEREKLNIASAGAGGLGHLAIEILRRQAGPEITHVPYRGAGPAVADVVGGNMYGMIMDLAGAYGALQDGKLRALGVMSETRSALQPQVPTFSEIGVLGIVAVNLAAMLAPVATPRVVVTARACWRDGARDGARWRGGDVPHLSRRRAGRGDPRGAAWAAGLELARH